MNKDNLKNERSNPSNASDDRTIRHETVPGEDSATINKGKKRSIDDKTGTAPGARSTSDDDLN
jgi:hypothetical protein